METIVLGGGCFWCLEAAYQLINGVEKVVSGYAGGSASDAHYHTVSDGHTGHAEVVQLTFDPAIISLQDIFDIYWVIHDPTTLNRQGSDVGMQYRSVIFYANDEQKQIASDSIKNAGQLWNDPIVTELAQLDTFYPAEDYHQNYFENNPDQAYCQVIINPKLTKLRQKFAGQLKK